MTVRFFVPASGGWAIWANGGELMGEFDLKGKRGNVPMGIDIGQDGQPGWWCKADCPRTAVVDGGTSVKLDPSSSRPEVSDRRPSTAATPRVVGRRE